MSQPVTTTHKFPSAPSGEPSPPHGQAATGPRDLVVLGSTGSIGVNTLDVVRHLNQCEPGSVRVRGLAAGRNAAKLIEQAIAFSVDAVAVADEAMAPDVRDALPGVRVFAGPDASVELMREIPATDVAAAVVGSAGLAATLIAIERGLRIGLSNKETLVAAGELVTPLVRRHHAALLPVDSEHSAIFQCLQGQPRESVKKIILTSSGGPFRQKPAQALRDATVEQALAHPTWTMGPKITIDSATMTNKALEIIEAHWLFDLPGEQIEVIVHPQSVIHSFVEFNDHSVLAQLGPPDMRTPIQYALTWPDRPAGCSQAMDWAGLRSLDFHPPDFEKFPALKLAYDVIEAGGVAGAIFNAANEAAVDLFLRERITLGRVFECVQEALSTVDSGPADSIEAVLHADRAARSFVKQFVATRGPGL